MAQQEQRSGQLVDRAFAFVRAVWLQAVILIAIAALTALDQLFKALAVYWLKGNPPHVLIDGVFELHYSENPAPPSASCRITAGFLSPSPFWLWSLCWFC